jgi:hypothetical protein
MKSSLLCIILILSLNTSAIFAGNNSGSPTDRNSFTDTKTLIVTLSPVMPKEADFEDVDLSYTIPVTASFFRKVAPQLPRNADFDDDILPVHVGKLVPALPMEAEF